MCLNWGSMVWQLFWDYCMQDDAKFALLRCLKIPVGSYIQYAAPPVLTSSACLFCWWQVCQTATPCEGPSFKVSWQILLIIVNVGSMKQKALQSFFSTGTKALAHHILRAAIKKWNSQHTLKGLQWELLFKITFLLSDLMVWTQLSSSQGL